MSDREYLVALCAALSGVSWHAQLREDGGLRLRVWHVNLPQVGETVMVACEPDGPWFRSSTGALLARCTDLPGAVRAIKDGFDAFMLGAFVPART